MTEERTKFGNLKIPFSTYDIFGYLIPGLETDRGTGLTKLNNFNRV
jgi:hypothetical protein